MKVLFQVSHTLNQHDIYYLRRIDEIRI